MAPATGPCHAAEAGHSPRTPTVIDADQGLLWVRTSTLVAIEDPTLNNVWGTGTFSRADLDDFRRQAAPTGGAGGGAGGEAGARTHPTRSLVGREVTCPVHASSEWLHEPWKRPTCRQCDLTRLCALVDAGEPDLRTQRRDPHPVTFDVGVGSYVPYTMLLDGNHRVAAASLRGDEFLLVSYAGDEERAHALLIAEQEPVSVLHA